MSSLNVKFNNKSSKDEGFTYDKNAKEIDRKMRKFNMNQSKDSSSDSDCECAPVEHKHNGTTGATGATGSAGTTGAKGSTGNTGATGSDGATGSTGTVVLSFFSNGIISGNSTGADTPAGGSTGTTGSTGMTFTPLGRGSYYIPENVLSTSDITVSPGNPNYLTINNSGTYLVSYNLNFGSTGATGYTGVDYYISGTPIFPQIPFLRNNINLNESNSGSSGYIVVGAPIGLSSPFSTSSVPVTHISYTVERKY